MAGSLHTFIFAAAVLIYITSALRIASPKTCTNGVMGPCIKGKCPKGGYCRPTRPGGPALCCRSKPVCRYGSTGVCVSKRGPKCAPESSCTIPEGSKIGQCCRKKPIKPPFPIEGCKYGQTGLCGRGLKCKPGSSCQYFKEPGPIGMGRCCRDKPIRPPFPSCKYGQTGLCDTRLKCRPGSSCQYFKGPGPKGLGRCCLDKPIRPPFPSCKYGQTGLCSKGRKCRPGSSCQYFKGPGPKGIGRCCRDKPIKPPFPRCPYGSDGLCGLKGLKCKPGSTCKYLSGRKGLGRCCRNKQLPGFCPPASPRPGICVFNPKVNCVNDAACPKGQLCCQEGCGKVCKKAIPFPVKLPAA